VRNETEPFTAPGTPHHTPSVAGRAIGMDQNHAERSAACCLLKFVSPTAIIRQRSRPEEIGFNARCRWFVDHDQDDLAAHVETLVVIPCKLRRLDTVTHEDHFRAYRYLLLVYIGACNKVIAQSELGRLCGAAARVRRTESQFELGIRFDAQHLSLL